jgi:LuxR family transcriptional regulator, maltose regulon positive regulatory protein
MAMTFSLHESIEPNSAFDYPETVFAYRNEEPVKEEFHILRDKLTMPEPDGLVQRPRLEKLLDSSASQFPATLICGRAGTGKTAIAASFAASQTKAFWYSVESTDTDWPVFSRYFSAALSGKTFGEHHEIDLHAADDPIAQRDIARFLVNRFSNAYSGQSNAKSLVVLDDIHHVFDAAWFDDFFNLLLYSLPPETHLLLTCRSKPPGPLWRLRSKQMLNVLDEKIIAFNADETAGLYKTLGLGSAAAKQAHMQCFGRVSKLLKAADQSSAKLSPSS